MSKVNITFTVLLLSSCSWVAMGKEYLKFRRAKSDINHGLLYFELHGTSDIQSRVGGLVFSVNDASTNERLSDFDPYDFGAWQSPLFQWWYLKKDSKRSSKKYKRPVGIFVLRTKLYILKRKNLLIKIVEPSAKNRWSIHLNGKTIERIQEDLQM